MRIAIGQLWQETNTLNPIPTDQTDFEAFGVYRGPELVDRMARTNEPGGMIQALRAWPERPEIVGLVRLAAWPGGLVTAGAWRWLQQELLGALAEAMPVDGVLLALHGSIAADGEPDVEGAVLGAVRERLGPGVPLVATLDLHANVTPAMVAAADVLVGYHTVPHVDVFATGTRAAAVLRRLLVDGVRPVTAFQKVPAVLPVESADTQAEAGPARTRRNRLAELEAQPGVLAAAVCTVQPWLDIPGLGSSVLVCTAGHPEPASRACAGLARTLWDSRDEYRSELVSAADAVAAARAAGGGLTVISDPADATTSGAPGDSVWLLRELLGHDPWQGPVLVPMVAPDAVEQARDAGAGSRIEVQLGGLRDLRFGTTIRFAGTVTRTFAARFVLSGHLGTALPIDMGPGAVLSHGQIHVIATARSGPHFAPELFQAAGFDPFAAAVLIAKSPCGFRAAYAGRAARIVVAHTPGCAPPDFWRYPFVNITRPLWPWDEIDRWAPDPILYPLRRAD